MTGKRRRDWRDQPWAVIVLDLALTAVVLFIAWAAWTVFH